MPRTHLSFQLLVDELVHAAFPGGGATGFAHVFICLLTYTNGKQFFQKDINKYRVNKSPF